MLTELQPISHLNKKPTLCRFVVDANDHVTPSLSPTLLELVIAFFVYLRCIKWSVSLLSFAADRSKVNITRPDLVLHLLHFSRGSVGAIPFHMTAHLVIPVLT